MPAAIAFAAEPLATVLAEIEPLVAAHFHEVCRDQDAVPLDFDWDAYGQIEALGRLVIVTARRAGALVGYAFALVGSHLHHRSTTLAQMDMYFLRPDCRGGRTALRLFQAIEREVTARGAVRFVVETLTRHDHGRLLRHIGYQPNEIMHAKILGAA